MINLDVDLSYLSRYYNIGASTIKQYRNKSITQIMQIEAAKGNERAAEFLIRITSNPKELAQLFQLVEPKNRYLILINMNEEDLMKVMEYLQPEELLLGLSIFNEDVILKLMEKLDPMSLAKVILEKMDESKFVKCLPEDYLDEFLSSDNINKEMMAKSLKEIDESELQKMMEHYTGQACYDDRDTIIQKMNEMDENHFRKAVGCFELKGKQQLVTGMIKKEPKLFQEFSQEALVHPFTQMKKDEVLKSLCVLDTKELLPMVEDMPQELMALVATQIDPEMFAKVLCSEFKDVIANCGIDLAM